MLFQGAVWDGWYGACQTISLCGLAHIHAKGGALLICVHRPSVWGERGEACPTVGGVCGIAALVLGWLYTFFLITLLYTFQSP
jgi:hypothetical protein